MKIIFSFILCCLVVGTLGYILFRILSPLSKVILIESDDHSLDSSPDYNISGIVNLTFENRYDHEDDLTSSISNFPVAFEDDDFFEIKMRYSIGMGMDTDMGMMEDDDDLSLSSDESLSDESLSDDSFSN